MLVGKISDWSVLLYTYSETIGKAWTTSTFQGTNLNTAGYNDLNICFPHWFLPATVYFNFYKVFSLLRIRILELLGRGVTPKSNYNLSLSNWEVYHNLLVIAALVISSHVILTF